MADTDFEASLRLVLQDELTRALKGVENDSDRASKGVEKGWRGAFKGMMSGFDEAQKHINAGNKLIKSGMVDVLGGAALAAPLVLAAKQAGEFADGMAEVATLTDKSARDITTSFGPLVNQIRTTFGQDSQQTIKALYDGLSSGVPATQAAVKDYLNATAQMSLGGKTDMASAADAITTVKNAWAFEGLSFTQIADQTFSAVRDGKTTITELSASMGQAAATVAGARVKYFEFSGAVAALTASGVKTPQAMTQIAAAIGAIQEPSAEAAKWFKRIGANITPLTLQQKGLVGTLDLIREKVNAHTKSEEKRKTIMQKIIGSVEAGRAVTALAGDQNEKFKQSVDNARKATGAMGEAADKMRTSPMFKYKTATQELQVAWESFGEAVTPLLTDILEAIRPVIKSTTDWLRDNNELVKVVGLLVLTVAFLVAGLGLLKIIGGVALLMKGLTVAIWGANAASLALLPKIGLMILSLGLVAALIGAVALLFYSWTPEGALDMEVIVTNLVKKFYQAKLAIEEAAKAALEFFNIGTPKGLDIVIQGSQAKIDEIDRNLADIEDSRRSIKEGEEKRAKSEGAPAVAGGAKLDLGGITNIIQGLPPTDAESVKKMMEPINKQIRDSAKQASRENLK